MGTPDFALESLKALNEHNYNINCVITNPDRPKGRGTEMNIFSCKRICNKEQYKSISARENKKQC